MSTRDGLRMAFGTLTALPVPPPGRVDRPVARTAMLLAPLPGMLLGALAAGILLLGGAVGTPALVSATAAVGAVALASRGLHLDGLADTADGLAASHHPHRALAVMRTGDVGPAGAVTLVLVLVAQVAALAALAPSSSGSDAIAAGAVATGLAVLAGRSVLPLVCAGPWPSARPDGLGAAVAGTVPATASVAVGATVLVAAGLLAAVIGATVVGVLAAVLAGWAAALLLVGRVARRIGGVTGDVLGAAVETATVVSLVVLASTT